MEFSITITADHLRLFASFEEQEPDACITVQAPVQLKIAGNLPENLSPLDRGLSFT
jgi:hypothetical protein